VAYSDPNFSFSPERQFTFDPNHRGTNGSSGTIPSPYVPSCNDQTSQVRKIYREQVAEYANLFGQVISYQPVKYNFNTHNFLYGQDPVSGYHYARKMKAIVDFSSYTTFLTKFGIMSDVEITIYIPIPEFERVWGPSSGITFPLAGDIFYIDDSACDRPLGQTPMVFEVTDKDDKIKPVDYMGGHYVWKLQAKRFDYSYEPNATEEAFLDDGPGDTKEFGRQPGGENPVDISHKEYDVDEFAQGEFDNTEAGNTYGKYM
jgi:hypothetical protein